MSKRKVAGTLVDPTIPSTPITINGTEYRLVFDFGSLADAEAHFNKYGHEVNILAALPVLNLSNTRTIFACAVRKFHPELTYEDATALVTLQTVFPIASTIADAWKAALPDPEPSGNAEAVEAA